MDRYEKEYREFGPWILEIQTDDDVPDLFRNKYTFDDSVESAIKIPIPLDRRQAEKGMDFYKSIVSFNKDEVIILEKTEKEITSEHFSYDRINAVKNMIDLLEAVLTIYTDIKEHKIKYNSVSEELMDKVLDILRYKYTINTEACRIESEFKGKITDQLFRNLINISAKKDKLTALSFQKTLPVKKEKRDIKDLILFNFNLELQSYIFLKTDKELVAVKRNREIKKKRAVDYSYNYTYIPFSNIKTAEFIPDPVFPDIYIFNITLENSKALSFITSEQTKEDLNEIADIYSF